MNALLKHSNSVYEFLVEIILLSISLAIVEKNFLKASDFVLTLVSI